jgi:hypothetical protein
MGILSDCPIILFLLKYCMILQWNPHCLPVLPHIYPKHAPEPVFIELYAAEASPNTEISACIRCPFQAARQSAG